MSKVFIGLDVSQKLTHLCAVGQEGKKLWQGNGKEAGRGQRRQIAAAVSCRHGQQWWWTQKGVDAGARGQAVCLDAACDRPALSFVLPECGMDRIRPACQMRLISLLPWGRRMRAATCRRHTLSGRRVPIAPQFPGGLKLRQGMP